MFGGLEVKGAAGGSNNKSNSNDSNPGERATVAPAAAPSSAFSFLNPAISSSQPPAAMTVPSAAAAAPSSAFSFLNPANAGDDTPAPIEGVPTGQIAQPAQQSAFGFLAAPAPDATTSESKLDLPSSGVEGIADPASDAAPSAFGFLSQVAPLTSEREQPPSGFNLLSLNPTILNNDGGGGDTVSTISRDSPEPSISSETMSSSFAPAGSGITFGVAAAAAAKPKVVKKRNRTARVGVVAGTSARTGLSNSEATSSRAGIPGVTNSAVSDPPGTSTVATREAALESTKRAEEFMNQKLHQEAAVPAISSTNDSASDKPLQFRHISARDQDGKDDDDDDSIVRKARAAAEEAQQQISKQAAATSSTSRFGLGGLFGRAGSGHNRTSPPSSSPPASTHGTSNTYGRPVAGVNTVKSHDKHTEIIETAAERLHREQEEERHAMAKRQLQTKHEHKPETDEDMRNKFFGTSTVGHDTAKGTFEPPAMVDATPSTQSARANTMSTTHAHEPAASKGQGMAHLSKQAYGVSRTTSAPLYYVKSKTPTEEFHSMLEDFRSNVEQNMSEVTRLREHRSGLLEERFVTMAKERLAIQQKAHAEAQQTTAAEAEDFELADRLGTLIESHERERMEFAAILENISRALQELDAQKDRLVAGVTNCFQEMESRLKEFKSLLEKTETEDAADAMERFSLEAKQLSAENDRLQHDLKMLERDAEMVAEERQELENAISEQAGEHEKLRDETKKQLSEVESEIEELRKQLERKQKIAAKLRTESAGHEENILKVRVKFSRQLTRVHKKESTVKDSREEWEMEKKSYEMQRTEHDLKVQAHSEALLTRDKLLDSLSKEIEMAVTFGEIVAKEVGLGMLPKDENGDDDGSAQMQADVVKCEAAVREAKEVLKASIASVNSLEDEIKFLNDQIPILEEQKKTAAASRDFKGAGKASKEIKDAAARLKVCEEELLVGAKERLSTIEREVESLQLELDQKRKVSNENERETCVAAMQRLVDNIRRLLATKDSVCGDASEPSIQSVAAYVLDSQIKALQVEGQTYGDKYGGWDEMIADVAGLENDRNKKQDLNIEDEVNCKQEKKMQEEQVCKYPSASDETQKEGSLACNAPPSIEERMQHFRDLTKRLEEKNQILEEAVEKEDFEKAADLDEIIQKLLTEVDSLNLSDEEMAAALAAVEPDVNSKDTRSSNDAQQEDHPSDVSEYADAIKSPEKRSTEEGEEEGSPCHLTDKPSVADEIGSTEDCTSSSIQTHPKVPATDE